LTRLLATRSTEAARADLTEAFLLQLGIGEAEGTKVAQELRTHALDVTHTPAFDHTGHGPNGKLGKSRGRSNGYSVARRLRKELKGESTSAA
jgi:hypothetical protein